MYRFDTKKGAHGFETALQGRCRECYLRSYGNGGVNDTIPGVGSGGPGETDVYFCFREIFNDGAD